LANVPTGREAMFPGNARGKAADVRRVTVIGTGYLGAVHAACMAESGHEVLGVDVDPAKL